MRKNIIKVGTLCAALAVSLLITGAVGGLYDAQWQRGSSAPAVSNPDGAKYIVKSQDGKVALFTGEFVASPAILTDIDVAALREYDRLMLEAGIPVDTYDEVLRLLEDFGP